MKSIFHRRGALFSLCNRLQYTYFFIVCQLLIEKILKLSNIIRKVSHNRSWSKVNKPPQPCYFLHLWSKGLYNDRPE